MRVSRPAQAPTAKGVTRPPAGVAPPGASLSDSRCFAGLRKFDTTPCTEAFAAAGQRHYERLLQAAKRGVWLEFMHPGMQKRTLSDLYFDRRSQKLLWHLEWHFVAAGLKIHDRYSQSRDRNASQRNGLCMKHLCLQSDTRTHLPAGRAAQACSGAKARLQG